MSDDNTASDNTGADLEGRTILGVRQMTDVEMQDEGWDPTTVHSPPVVLELDDGTLLYPSRDPEGNGPGALFGRDGGGNPFALRVIQHG